MGEAEVEPDVVDRPTPEEEEFARTLGSLSSRVSAILEEHLSCNDGLVFTFFLTELGKWYIESCRRRAENREEFSEARTVAEAVGARFADDADMEEPIAVGFVEMFVGLPEPDQPCAEFLPQPLKEEYLRMKAWKARPPG